MLLLTISSALLAFCALSISLGRVGHNIDLRERRLKAINGRLKGVLDEELEKSFYRRFISPSLKSAGALFLKLVPKKKGKKDTGTLAKDLRLAGIRLSSEEYSMIRAVLSAVVLLLILLFMAVYKGSAGVKFLVFLCGSVGVILVPRYYLRHRINSRQMAILNQMPSVIDILSVSIEAGLGFDSALVRVITAFKGPLIDEFSLLHTELQMGRQRREALKALGERSNVAELKTFSSSIIQSDQLGIPIKNVLRSQATQLRASRKQRAEEKGMKAPIKMMLPMVAFVFPVIFIILLGPTVIRLMEQFG